MIILSIIDKIRRFLVYPLSIKLSQIRPIAKIHQNITKYTTDQKKFNPANLPESSPIVRLWYFFLRALKLTFKGVRSESIYVGRNRVVEYRYITVSNTTLIVL